MNGDGEFINPINDEVMENLTIDHKTIHLNELQEVVFLESIGGFTRKYCSNGREFLVENNLSQLEENLPKEKFFKINESYIINADYLKRIKVRAIKNVLLRGGIELNVAQDRYWELIRFLKFNYSIW